MKTTGRTALIAVILAAGCVLAEAQETVRIKATKKIQSKKTESGQAASSRGGVQSSETLIFYRFELQRMNTSVPEKVTVQWIVLVRPVFGGGGGGPFKEQEVTLPMGSAVAVDSDTVALKEHEWRGWGGGRAEDSVYGYGIRILDGDGKLIVEKFSPNSAKEELAKRLEQRAKGEESDPPPPGAQPPPSRFPGRPRR